MRIRIESRSLELDPELRRHVTRRIGFALGRFSDRIRQVDVRLEDENGPRNGIDTGCKVRVRLDPAGELLVSGIEQDARRSADRTLERAARRVARHLDSRRDPVRREQDAGGAS